MKKIICFNIILLLHFTIFAQVPFQNLSFTEAIELVEKNNNLIHRFIYPCCISTGNAVDMKV